MAQMTANDKGYRQNMFLTLSNKIFIIIMCTSIRLFRYICIDAKIL